MLMALRGILVSLLGVYYFTFFKDYNNVKKSNKLLSQPYQLSSKKSRCVPKNPTLIYLL